MAVPLLMDVDTGVDDAMAIALATRLTSHELVAITTVAGNVPLELATRNTLRVLAWMGSSVPVHQGMSRPLVRPLHTAMRVHGNDGLGGWLAPESSQAVEDVRAPEAILQVARRHKGEIEGAFVGPLTNLAVALSLEPDLATWFKRVTIMGGAFFNPGNVTPSAEFNTFVDPEAADIVARSGLETTWIGLDVTHQTKLSAVDWKALAARSGRSVELIRNVCRQSFEERGLEQVYLHDPLAVAVVSDPTLVETATGQVVVNASHHARGETRVAQSAHGSRIAAGVNSDAFKEMLARTLELA